MINSHGNVKDRAIETGVEGKIESTFSSLHRHFFLNSLSRHLTKLGQEAAAKIVISAQKTAGEARRNQAAESGQEIGKGMKIFAACRIKIFIDFSSSGTEVDRVSVPIDLIVEVKRRHLN